LEGEVACHWEGFVRNLQKEHITIKDEEESLALSKNLIYSNYTTSMGYRAMFSK
jgi:hypothetical protein